MEKKTNDSQVIVITSGKGGVGKTTAVANISTGLASRDYKVAVIDLDIGLKKLDLILGLENRVIYDIVQVAEEECTLKQALVKDKRFQGLYMLPAAQTRNKEDLTGEQVKKIGLSTRGTSGSRARFGSSRLQISQTPVNTCDIMPTLAAQAAGIDASNYPADMFHMTGSNRTRYFYFCTKNEELSEIGVLELKIDGNVLNWENWSTTGVVHDYSDRQWKQIGNTKEYKDDWLSKPH